MVPELFEPPAGSPVCLGALILSEVRFLRESLAEILQRTPGILVRGHSATLAHALASAVALRPELVLLDVAFPGGPQTAVQLCAALPGASVIAIAIIETEANVLAWAASGIAGYVPNTASVNDLAVLIGEISRGEQTCPSHIAGSMLRRIGATGVVNVPVTAPASALTPRESVILGLVGEGLSNKDIARRLGISLGTTKSHVHNLLGKLSVHRRTEAMTRLNTARNRGIDTGPGAI